MSSALDSLLCPPPRFFAHHAERAAAAIFNLSAVATPTGGERDRNFLLRSNHGDEYILKVANAAEPDARLAFQNAALAHIRRCNPELPVSRLIKTAAGQEWGLSTGDDDHRYRVRLLNYLPGAILKDIPHHHDLMHDLGRVLGRLDLALGGFFHPAADYPLAWDLKRLHRLAAVAASIPVPADKALVAPIFDTFVSRVQPRLCRFRAQVIHNDVSFHNVVVDPDAASSIRGIFDFGDLIHAPLIQELAVTASEVSAASDDPLTACAEIVAGYHRVVPLQREEIDVLPYLMCGRLALQITLSHWADAATSWQDDREELVGWHARAVFALRRFVDTGAEKMARTLARGCASAAGNTAVPGHRAPHPSVSPWARRLKILGNAKVIAYDRPLHVVRGEGVWLYGSDGERYLDCYNNVPHVGHCHPRVVAAVANQTATLNTNTRYVYDAILDYAERLSATLPSGLEVCYFVSSGSEANDLAWRLARAVTGNAGAIVMHNAYHGVTEAAFALSPAEWPRAWQGEPGGYPHVATLPAPNDYRGRWRRDVADRGGRYAQSCAGAIETLARRGYAPAAFFIDTILSSNGIFPPPPGFLAEIFRQVRAAGGVCVADEVQSGFGRDGAHMWGFESDDVVPDIVTLGKPIANGYPMGAVVTTRAIADCFAGHGEFFSTTGGNPVACAAALAVLDVIHDEDLIVHAHRVGATLMDGIRGLAGRHEIIGDVRGSGLFIGVELVKDRQTRAPADAETHRVVNLLRDAGVLVGTAGPCPPARERPETARARFDNVLKLRPPMAFDSDHAARLLAALDTALGAVQTP